MNSTTMVSAPVSGQPHPLSPRLRRPVLFLLLLPLLGLFAGCKSPETAENEASRPWNAPRQWETGLPGFNQYDRR